MINPWPPACLDGEPQLLHDVLRRNELAGRNSYYTRQLEQMWRDHTGARFSIATVSGTAALTLAVRALKAEPGDEVVVPAFTFAASALAILHAGLIPRFCDVKPRTYCVDFTSAETVVNDRTRAIMIVHLNGVPADMSDARQFAVKHDLPIIEDACQAHGGRWKGQRVGNLGFAGAFSFNRTKSLPAGEGGMFITSSEDAYRTALAAYQFGELPFTSDEDRSYHSVQMGWMFRPTEFVTALAAHRMSCLDDWIATRRTNHKTLTGLLQDVDSITVQEVPTAAQPSFWRYAFTLSGDLARNPVVCSRLIAMLQAAGIRSSRWQNRVLPDHQVFTNGYGSGCPWSCHHRPSSAHAETPNARELARTMIWLEDVIAPTNGETQVSQVADAIRTSIKKAQTKASR